MWKFHHHLSLTSIGHLQQACSIIHYSQLLVASLFSDMQSPLVVRYTFWLVIHDFTCFPREGSHTMNLWIISCSLSHLWPEKCNVFSPIMLVIFVRSTQSFALLIPFYIDILCGSKYFFVYARSILLNFFDSLICYFTAYHSFVSYLKSKILLNFLF